MAMKRCSITVMLFVTVTFFNSGYGLEPSFDVPIVNVTVVAGKTAILPCSINHLNDRNVIWMDPRNKLLTLQESRIIADERISLERPFIKEWNLHVRDVKASDSGEYSCQINTDPIRIKRVVLTVHVPAQIIDYLSSDAVVTKEGETVTLICNATGIPHPKVKWYRITQYDGKRSEEEIGIEGEVLIIHNITRYCDDTYECIAYNGIGSGSTRQIDVSVEYQPEIRLPNKRIGQYRGKDTILECIVNSNPLGVTQWNRNGQKLDTSWKYRVEVYNDDNHVVTLSLRIRNLDESDFGNYECYAENKFGKDQEVMILYDYQPKTTTTTTTTPYPPTWAHRPWSGGSQSVIPTYYNSQYSHGTNNGGFGYNGKKENGISYEKVDGGKHGYNIGGEQVDIFTKKPGKSQTGKMGTPVLSSGGLVGTSRSGESGSTSVLVHNLVGKSLLLLGQLIILLLR